MVDEPTQVRWPGVHLPRSENPMMVRRTSAGLGNISIASKPFCLFALHDETDRYAQTFFAPNPWSRIPKRGFSAWT